jgi:predicted anti-sigma-YlaC factor YlaD
MHCEIARDRILEADPSELNNDVTGDLAEHLAGCDACRALAGRVLKSERTLAGAIAAMEPGRDVDAALARVPRRQGWGSVWGWRGAGLALPLAAAAVVALVMLKPPGDSGQAVAFDPSAPVVARTLGWDRPAPVVRSISHSSIAILPTDNPDITIVWFMNR